MDSNEAERRLLNIIRGDAECPRCGAAAGDACLTWRGDTFLDGTRHACRDAAHVGIGCDDVTFRRDREASEVA